MNPTYGRALNLLRWADSIKKMVFGVFSVNVIVVLIVIVNILILIIMRILILKLSRWPVKNSPFLIHGIALTECRPQKPPQKIYNKKRKKWYHSFAILGMASLTTRLYLWGLVCDKQTQI